MKGVTDSLWPSKLIKNRLFQKPTVNVIVKGANEWNKEGNSSHLRLRAGHVYLPNVEKEGEMFPVLPMTKENSENFTWYEYFTEWETVGEQGDFKT